MTDPRQETEAELVARLERVERKRRGEKPARKPNWKDRYNKAMENFVPAPF